MVFGGITDQEGNRGVFAIMGARLDTIQEYEGTYEDFSVYCSESSKSAPVIRYDATGPLCIGTYGLTEFISAGDEAGTTYPVYLLGMWDTEGKEIDVAGMAELGQISFAEPGIYTVKVAAADTEYRRTVATIRIPVNSRKGMG